MNLAGNRTLIETVLRLGDFSPSRRVVELYCGAGNLSLPLASRVGSLIGLDQDRVAVANARAMRRGSGLTPCALCTPRCAGY